jgi:fatty-acid desaturase
LRWWEVDCTYYLVRVLGWVGVVREIREPKIVAEETPEVEPELALL